MRDGPTYPTQTRIDLAFEALALLAGTLEAKRALRRFSSQSSETGGAESKKKFTDALVGRNVNTISDGVNNAVGDE